MMYHPPAANAVKYTTVDMMFDQLVQFDINRYYQDPVNYHWYAGGSDDAFLLSNIVYGQRGKCGISWENVDRVLIPIRPGSDDPKAISHYVLAVFMIDERKLVVYNSLNHNDDRLVRILEAYCGMIPKLLEVNDFQLFRPSYNNFSNLTYTWAACPKQGSYVSFLSFLAFSIVFC